MITEQDIVKRLKEELIQLPPLRLTQVTGWDLEPDANTRVDAVAWVSWANQKQRFAVEFKALSTPKVIRGAMYQVKVAAQEMKLIPMIIVPYLNEEALRELEREGVSGVDLCGNGIVVAPGKFSVYRTGNRNQFSSSAPIKNIYRRNSSMVGRLLLAKPQFDRVTDILGEVNRRNILGTWAGDPMALPTVSKVLKVLEDDMIVGRDRYTSKLLQADKLLDALRENYTPPKVKDVINWQIPIPSSGGLLLNEALSEAFKSDVPAVFTGASASSISFYAVMQAGGTNSIYCPDPGKWLAKVPGVRTDRFPTISVIQTEEASVYFDAQREKNVVFASPIQTYLELMEGDKRDQETAIQVRDYILKRLAGVVS
jgi:hypothetical protein